MPAPTVAVARFGSARTAVSERTSMTMPGVVE